MLRFWAEIRTGKRFSQLLEWHGFYEPGRGVKKRHANSTSKVPADQALQFGTGDGLQFPAVTPVGGGEAFGDRP